MRRAARQAWRGRLPEDLRRRRIDLRENAITSVPDVLAELPALDRLDLRWNGFLDPPAVVERLRARGCVVWL
jgi:hypothetical protein